MKIPNFLQIIIGIISKTYLNLATFLIMKLTAEGFQKNNIQYLFKVNSKKQTDMQIQLLSLYSLYFAFFVILMKILQWIFNQLNLISYVATAERIVKNSFDYFIILGLILFYLMRNTKNGSIYVVNQGKQIDKKFILYAFWFILGRIVFALGFLLTTLLSKYNINGKIVGVALTYAQVTMMIVDICGYNSFNLFDIFPSIGNQL